MSEALYGLGGLRFWSEREIIRRDALVAECAHAIQEALCSLNPAWTMHRCEGPILTPPDRVSAEYGESDLFVSNHSGWVLRAETTASSYVYATHLLAYGKAKAPLCVWQLGRSFRRELNDGARASTLRFNEFQQLEFQAIYRADSKASYRGHLITAVSNVIKHHIGRDVGLFPSDRTPSYAESTIDILGDDSQGKEFELASCSIRTDFPPINGHEMRVAEIAIGVDRVITIGG